MGSKMIMVAAFILFWVLQALVTEAEAGIFDVKEYGAKADGRTDDSKAISSAWKEACASRTPSMVVISRGNYRVGPLNFQGPCKAPISIKIQGTLQAPADLDQLKSQHSWVLFQGISDLTVLGGGTFDGQGELDWKINNCAKTGKCNSLPINLSFNKIDNSVVQDITSKDSKLFHINILGCNNLTLQHITITAPETSLNTDGIHVGRSNRVNISDANIKTGDDCVSLGDGSQEISIEKVTCGPGHGISVGSLGKYHSEEPVIGVTVRNCTLTSTMNGVRVKTWPSSPSGLASDLHFEDIIMKNVSNPILIDQDYCPYGECQEKAPSRVKITNVSFTNIRGTSATQLAVKLACSKGVPCRNVEIGDINLPYKGRDGTAISECSNVKPVVIGYTFPPACANKSI